MNKVEKVSIGGYAFSLDQEAYSELSSYLDELKVHYGKQDGGTEILEGIEERITDLFIEKCGASGIVGLEDVRAVIAKLGRPEAIDEESSESGNAPEQQEKPAPATDAVRKKLYRDLQGKQLGGVCSGLGAYFGIDAAILRIVFVVGTLLMLFAGSEEWLFLFPLLYIVLWLCMPAAKTVQQRCEMRGEDGTLQDICRNVGNGAKEIEETVKGHSDLLRIIGRTLAVCLGLLLLVIGISGITGGAVFVFGQKLFGISLSDLYELSPEVVGEAAHLLGLKWMKILAMLVYFIPFFASTYAGVMLIFNFRSPSWRPGLIMFLIWICAIIVLSILGTAGFVSNGHIHDFLDMVSV